MAKEWILNMATNRWGLNKKIVWGLYHYGLKNAIQKQ
jgi:hypothetical protein